MAEVKYRTPTIADAEAIARLHVVSWREAYAGIVPDRILQNVDMNDRVAHWQEYLAGDGITFLAEAGGTPAGFIRAGQLAEPMVQAADGHIFALYILKAFQRRGIGARLLGLAARDWLASGGQALSVGVLTGNTPAVAFYERMGGRFVRAETYEWDGHALPESLYVFEDLEVLAGAA